MEYALLRLFYYSALMVLIRLLLLLMSEWLCICGSLASNAQEMHENPLLDLEKESLAT